jgi:hypothetical protein
MNKKKDRVTEAHSAEYPPPRAFSAKSLPALGFYEVRIHAFIDDANMNIYGDVLRALDEIGHRAWEMGWRIKYRPISFAESLYTVPALNFELKEHNRICAARPAEKSA